VTTSAEADAGERADRLTWREREELARLRGEVNGAALGERDPEGDERVFR
jgi:hypothetical protein